MVSYFSAAACPRKSSDGMPMGMAKSIRIQHQEMESQ